jgi:hypothetical protein
MRVNRGNDRSDFAEFYPICCSGLCLLTAFATGLILCCSCSIGSNALNETFSPDVVIAINLKIRHSENLSHFEVIKTFVDAKMSWAHCSFIFHIAELNIFIPVCFSIYCINLRMIEESPPRLDPLLNKKKGNSPAGSASSFQYHFLSASIPLVHPSNLRLHSTPSRHTTSPAPNLSHSVAPHPTEWHCGTHPPSSAPSAAHWTR